MADLSDLEKLPAITKFIERCIVTAVPAGAVPKDITIQLPDADGAKVPVRYTGFPPGLAINDEVSIRATPQDTIRYVIDGTSGATAPKVGKKFDHVLFVSSTAPNADYPTIAAAIAAASTGDALWLDAETFTLTSALAINKKLHIFGSPYGTKITLATAATSTINNTADGTTLFGLEIENTATGDGADTAAPVATSQDLNVIQCKLSKSGAIPNAYGIWAFTNALTLDVQHTSITVVGGTTSSKGIVLVSSGNALRLEGGSVDGATYDIEVGHASASAKLIDPVLENALLNLTGTATGRYFDDNGDIYIVSGTEVASDVILSAGVTETKWYDASLIDSSEGEHFKDNTATYPATWTEVNAPANTNTDDLYSFWRIIGNSVELAWEYKKQTGKKITDVTASFFASFPFGPLMFRDGNFTADVDYFIGLYSDNGAGAIDTTIYARTHLWWDSANTLWKIRGEESDGAAPHTGAWQTLTFPLSQPLWITNQIFNVAGQWTRSSVGTTPELASWSLLLAQVPTAANWDTSENLWVRIHQTRGAGVSDFLFIGATDFAEVNF